MERLIELWIKEEDPEKKKWMEELICLEKAQSSGRSSGTSTESKDVSPESSTEISTPSLETLTSTVAIADAVSRLKSSNREDVLALLRSIGCRNGETLEPLPQLHDALKMLKESSEKSTSEFQWHGEKWRIEYD